MKILPSDEYPVIIPNINKRFSGITATILSVAPVQMKDVSICSTFYHLSDKIPHLSFLQILKLTSKPLSNGHYRLIHTRRNIEMIYALLLKHFLFRKIQILFTSTAQRKHTWITKFLYKRVDFMITTSNRAASYLDARDPQAIVPHGVDTSLFKPTQLKTKAKEIGINTKYAVGIFGRVREQKGLSEFVNAMCEVLPKCPDWTAFIFGQTTPKFVNYEKKLKEKIEKLGLTNRFVWMGRVPFEETRVWYANMDLVLCVPRNEGFGLTCLEAMASQVPVVATKTGAFEMIIREDIDGKTIPCGDTKALIKALNELMPYPEKLAEMGINAKKRIDENFTIQREAQSLNAIYSSILLSGEIK